MDALGAQAFRPAKRAWAHLKVCATVIALVGLPALASAQSRGGSVPRAKALELFSANCQPCHGPDGKGTPAFKDLAFAGRTTWKHGGTQANVVKTITNGAPGTAMLPFKGRLSPAEISALASLVRSFAAPHKK